MLKKGGYTRLEYLESTGKQYIDTGIKLNQNSRVKIKYQYSSNTSTARIMGDAHNDSSGWILTTANGSINSKIQILYGSKWYPLNWMPQSKIPFTDIITYESIGINQYVNGDLYYTNVSSNFETTSNALVFGAYYNSLQLASVKIFELVISVDGQTLSRIYIPVLDSNNRPCLFDKVSKTCFYNQGTGEFLYG